MRDDLGSLPAWRCDRLPTYRPAICSLQNGLSVRQATDDPTELAGIHIRSGRHGNSIKRLAGYFVLAVFRRMLMLVCAQRFRMGRA